MKPLTVYVVVDKKIFKKMNYKVKVSPLGNKKCCCGYKNCIEVECLSSLTLQRSKPKK